MIKSLGRGGAEVLLPETLRFAERDRFTYRYAYFLPWKDSVVPDLEALGVQVDCLPASHPVSILLKARRVAHLMRDWDADVAHCHMPLAGVVGRIAGKMASVPVVYTEHNVLERYNPLTQQANVLTWRWQEEVIAVSREVAVSLRNRVSDSVPVKVVPNGVDVVRFDSRRLDSHAIRRKLEIDVRAPVVGTVAVFRLQKRLDDWLHAARLLLDRNPDSRFLLVGDGPLRSELEAKARRLSIDHAVHWVGLQTDVRPYLAAMDVYMMSSVFEGLPIALLEAMAMRCPVVCTAVGGIPEVVRNDWNGRLVDAGDPSALADAATKLLRCPDDAERMGEAARHTVEERFSIQRVSREIEATYVDVIGRYRNGQ